MTPNGPPSGRPLRFLIVLTAMCSILSGGPPSDAGTTPSADVLRLRYWQAPTLLNPHLSTGNKDQEASRLTYEPLASFDAEGRLVPFLAKRPIISKSPTPATPATSSTSSPATGPTLRKPSPSTSRCQVQAPVTPLFLTSETTAKKGLRKPLMLCWGRRGFSKVFV